MNWNRRNIILSALLPVQICIIQYLSHFQNIIEIYYAEGLYPILSKFLRVLFGWVPFSVGDILLLIFLVVSIRFVFVSFKRKLKEQPKRILAVFAVFSILHCCFYLFWGLNYFRKPLESKFEFQSAKYTTEALTKTTYAIISKANLYHSKIALNDSVAPTIPYSRKVMYEISLDGFKSLSKDYPEFEYRKSSLKHSAVSLFQSYNGTSGYLNPLTGEAQVNRKIPKTGYPTTICHEIGHQLGYAAENEANFISFLAANYNEDLYFKYSSYRMALAYCLNEVRKRNPENHKELLKSIRPGILKDYAMSYQFWQQYTNPFEPILKKGYNAYLKVNNQQKGIESYNYIVDLLIAYHQFKGEI